MSYSMQVNELLSAATDAFQAVIDKAAKEQNEQFQNIVADFIDGLNARYKRHCFIFCDAMGNKSVEMYHRVTGERLCWWSCNDGRFDERCPKIAIRSGYRDFNGSNLDSEVNEFMESLSLFESSLRVGYYFAWEGKQNFDHVVDSIH